MKLAKLILSHKFRSILVLFLLRNILLVVGGGARERAPTPATSYYLLLAVRAALQEC